MKKLFMESLMLKKMLMFAVMVMVLAITPSVFAAPPTPGTATSNAVIQNLTDQTATLVVTYYQPNGDIAYTNPSVTIPGNSVREIKTADEPLPAGFAGSAVVSSDREIAAIVSIRYTNVPADPDGKSQGAYNGFSQGATEVFFPSIWDFDGIVSQFTVMNTEGTPATVDLTYYNRQGGTVGTRQVTIPAYAGTTFDMANDSQTPSGFGPDGSVTATSTNALAGASTAIYPNRAAAYQAMSSTDRGTVLYASSQFRFKLNPSDSDYTLFSAVNIQNAGDQAAQVTVEYFNRATGNKDLTLNLTIQPGAAAGLNTANGGDLAASAFNALGTDFSGSVKITSTNDVELVGTNVTQWGSGVRKAAISALGSDAGAASTIFVPAQYRLLSGSTWNQWTSVNVQNVGDSTIAASDLTIRYVDTAGNVTKTFTGASLPSNVQGGLESGAALGLNTRNGGDFPNGNNFNSFGDSFIGGVIVEGPAGSELIATANIVYSDRASSYNGFGE